MIHSKVARSICIHELLNRILSVTWCAVQGHRKFITSLSWEPAHVELPSRRFCSGSKDATIKVWEASTR